MQSVDPKTRILEAATTCLDQQGIDGATVRRIAAKAGVNVAAVNYHFGSKARLLELALAQALDLAFVKALSRLQDAIAKNGGDIRRGTEVFLRDYLSHAFQQPRITHAHLRDALTHQQYGGLAVQEIRRFVEEFERIIAPAMAEPNQVGRRAAVLHAWATVLNLAMMPELFANFAAAQELPDRIRPPLMATLFGRLPGAGFTRVE